jgi:hypothetical protein
VPYIKKATFSSCIVNWPFPASLEYYFVLIISFLSRNTVKGIHPTSDHTGRRVKGGHCILSFGKRGRVFESKLWHGCTFPSFFCICLIMCRSLALGRTSALGILSNICVRIKEVRKRGDMGLFVLCALQKMKKTSWDYTIPYEIIFLIKNRCLMKMPRHAFLDPDETFTLYTTFSRSQWSRGLRRRSAAARLLGLRVRIPPEAWMSVCCECCVWSGRGLCVMSITRPEKSYRMWCVWVWS